MRRRCLCAAISTVLLFTSHFSPTLQADIFQWELVNPGDPSQGKQPSTTLCPDGAGLTPEPNLQAYSKDLTQGYLINYDLSRASFYQATLNDADFSGANLTDASFYDATLINTNLTDAILTDASFANANMTGATIAGARLTSVTSHGFTQAQFESTASYATGELTGIKLVGNDLTGWNFAGKNLIGAWLSADCTGANLEGANLTDAHYGGANFTNANLSGANLTYATTDRSGATFAGANMAGANLTHAEFWNATFTGADLTGATITGANFEAWDHQVISKAQFESTTNYATGNLSGMGFGWNSLNGWNFAGKNLTGSFFYCAGLSNADFREANLTEAFLGVASLWGADFTGATITGANLYATTNSYGDGFTQAQFESTASYINDELTDIDLSCNYLTDWNFAGKNLSGAVFSYSTLTDADFSGATVAGASFDSTTDIGFTQSQFQSTASYASGELERIWLNDNDLTGWNFVGKNLAYATFGDSDLTDTDFTGANLHRAYFSYAKLTNTNFTGANLAKVSFLCAKINNVDFTSANLTDGKFRYDLTGSNLNGADARGASNMPYTTASDTTNFVQPDGRVEGLNVEADSSFRVWDYDGLDTGYDGLPDTLLGITVGEGFSIDYEGTLIIGLEDGTWGSTIAFDAGIDVSFDGTLEVEFRGGFVPLAGYHQWQLFDFTGVTPIGDFDSHLLPDVAGSTWDTSRLLSDGILSLTVPLPGDANADGVIDADDAAALAANWLTTSGATWAQGDFDGNGRVDDADAAILAANWQQTTTPPASVPEPGSIVLILFASLTCLLLRR